MVKPPCRPIHARQIFPPPVGLTCLPTPGGSTPHLGSAEASHPPAARCSGSGMPLRAEHIPLIVPPLNSSSILRTLLLLCVLSGHVAAAAAKQPNILVIVADDLGFADLRVHGGRDVPTPHLDALAASGVRCNSGYVSAPYCSPSRAGFLTGRSQTRFGHEFNPHVGEETKLGLPLDQPPSPFTRSSSRNSAESGISGTPTTSRRSGTAVRPRTRPRRPVLSPRRQKASSPLASRLAVQPRLRPHKGTQTPRLPGTRRG